MQIDRSGDFFSLVGEELDADWVTFHQNAAEGRLVIQQCERCETFRWPPATACATCQGLVAAWIPVPARGTVWSYCVAHPPVVPYLADRVPATVALVSLDIDHRLRILGEVPTADGLEIGDTVIATFRRITDEVGVPVWVREPVEIDGSHPAAASRSRND